MHAQKNRCLVYAISWAPELRQCNLEVAFHLVTRGRELAWPRSLCLFHCNINSSTIYLRISEEVTPHVQSVTEVTPLSTFNLLEPEFCN